MDIEEAIKTEDFKKKFWAWFDNLPSDERFKFQYYNWDASELFFYNKFYRYIPVVNC